MHIAIGYIRNHKAPANTYVVPEYVLASYGAGSDEYF